jgi:glucosamine--fructose-6-phosphate aminotransferase (isomerizing)
MCGIIGCTGTTEAVPAVIEGLRRLEYRGYDSAGIAYLNGGEISVIRCQGKIRDLERALGNTPPSSTAAIGHTRWATHGRPSDANAHPHRSGGIVVVHNGIVENYLELKRSLEHEGCAFSSETDTEVICHLIRKYSDGRPLRDSVREALTEVRGAYALAVMSDREPGTIVGVRKDSPLVVGLGEGAYFVASDIPAFLAHTRSIVFLEDNEMVVLTSRGAEFLRLSGESIEKQVETISWDPSMAEKGGFKHFMLKEIHEQPRSVGDTLAGRITPETGEVVLEEFHLTPDILAGASRIFIVACGTSWHAAIVGKYLIEELAGVPVETDVASEFRYRSPIIGPGDIFITITQSGETADTLAAQRLAASRGATVLSICNVIGSTSAREAGAVFYTRSGPEIGVASTKAFTAQLVGLFLFAIALGKIKGHLDDVRADALVRELLAIPDKVEKILGKNDQIEAIARELYRQDNFLYLGRGINHPIAFEGALKLKEISYIHAQAYAAGEMKHGPIALISEGYPVVFILANDRLYEKTLSNVQEIRSRGGRIIAVTTEDGEDPSDYAETVMTVPGADPLVQPILFAVPLQLLAYHIGVLRGCDVDQPRNLAKSVTVE